MKEIKCLVASSYNENTQKCGYGIMLINEIETIDIVTGCVGDCLKVKSYQVSGYLTGVIKAIQYAIDNKYELVTIVYNFDGADKYTKITKKDSFSDIVKEYMESYETLASQINIRFEKGNTNYFLTRSKFTRLRELAKKQTIEEFDKFHILNPKNYYKRIQEVEK